VLQNILATETQCNALLLSKKLKIFGIKPDAARFWHLLTNFCDYCRKNHILITVSIDICSPSKQKLKTRQYG